MTSANWKQLAGFTKYDGTPSVQDRLSSSDQRVIPIGTHPPAGTQDFVEFSQDATPDDDISLSGDSIATMQAPEGELMATVENVPDTPTAGISSRGRVRKMSRAMQDSVSQRDFYGNRGMHYMGNKATLSVTEEAEEQCILEHENHLSLQERMRHPIAFHAEMMGDIMYFHQALQQPDAGEFVKAVIKEINGHIEHQR